MELNAFDFAEFSHGHLPNGFAYAYAFDFLSINTQVAKERERKKDTNKKDQLERFADRNRMRSIRNFI